MKNPSLKCTSCSKTWGRLWCISAPFIS